MGKTGKGVSLWMHKSKSECSLASGFDIHSEWSDPELLGEGKGKGLLEMDGKKEK
jgi:hypothetical protein